MALYLFDLVHVYLFPHYCHRARFLLVRLGLMIYKRLPYPNSVLFDQLGVQLPGHMCLRLGYP